MAIRGTLLVKVDPTALKLIEACAQALDRHGLADLIDELSERYAFARGVWHVESIRGVKMVRLGTMTDLLLCECLDVAQRPRWSTAFKRAWLRQAMDAAGFAGSQ